MRIQRATPTLDAVKAVLRTLSGSYEFTLDAFDRGLSDKNAEKMKALVKADRNFLRVTPHLTQLATQALAMAFSEVISKGGQVRTEHILNQVGLGVRGWILYRFEHQGPDVTLTHLSPAWASAKARNRLDPRIGIATKALIKAIARSPFRLRKVR